MTRHRKLAGAESPIEAALDLVGRIYEAAADPEVWPAALSALSRAAGSEGSVIWLHDFTDSSAELQPADMSFTCEADLAAGAMRRYVEHFTYVNPWIGSVEAQPECSVLCSSAILAEQQLRKGEFYADWLRPQGLAYALGGPVLKRGNTIAMLSLLRSESLGPYRERDLQLLRLLLPHLRRACLLHRRLARLKTERIHALEALDMLSTAAWLLDAQGKLLFANRAGLELDAQHDGLWLDQEGRPRARKPEEHHALQHAIVSATASGQGRSLRAEGAVRVRRCRRPASLLVMVYPMAGDALVPGSAAVLFIIDPASAAQPDTRALQALYELTPTEAQMAAALARGDSLDHYCRAHGVSNNTARTHLKRIMCKTDTHRQSDVVRIVSAVSMVRAGPHESGPPERL